MAMIKVHLIILFVLGLISSSFAQNLADKSKGELQTMKQEAIASENYDLATKIKKELKTRKTIDETIAEKNTAINKAVAVENYEKAEQLQKEIDQLTANKAKIAQLKIEKKTAITTEDYDRVIVIDKEIKALKSLKPKNDRPLTGKEFGGIQPPTTFSPDGDGINDTWVLENINNYKNATVQIFNRWGSLLYETNGKYIPWDGYSNGKRLPSESYFYNINLNNEDAPYNGTFTIEIIDSASSPENLFKIGLGG